MNFGTFEFFFKLSPNEDLIKNVFAEEVPPTPTIESTQKRDSTPKRRTQVSQFEKKDGPRMSKDQKAEKDSRTRRGVSARLNKSDFFLNFYFTNLGQRS